MKTCLVILLICCGATLGILNGESPGRKDLLYMATLFYKNNPVGAAVVIDSKTILTKAPPLYVDAADYAVVVGATKLIQADIVQLKFDDFIRDSSNTLAIIKLQTAITDPCYVKPVTLPSTDVGANVIGVVGGWGATTYEPNNPTPSKDLTAISQTVDNTTPGCGLNIYTFCAKNTDTTKNTCYFDEGAPFVKQPNNELVGIVSQVGCTVSSTTIYINVYNFLNFINTYKEPTFGASANQTTTHYKQTKKIIKRKKI